MHNKERQDMLTIIIGGKAQGKLAYTIELTGYGSEAVMDEEELTLGEDLSKPILNHFHLYIRKALQQSYDLQQLIEQIAKQKQDVYLICDEVGSGVVPMDAFERSYREQVGRTMCQLTKIADRVIRIQCGIGTVIKDKVR